MARSTLQGRFDELRVPDWLAGIEPATDAVNRELIGEFQKTGDSACLDQLVRRNSRLVLLLTRRFPVSKELQQDLFQEGLLAVCRCATGFDLTAGYSFTAYMTRAARRSMNQYFSAHGARTGSLSSSYRDRAYHGKLSEEVLAAADNFWKAASLAARHETADKQASSGLVEIVNGEQQELYRLVHYTVLQLIEELPPKLGQALKLWLQLGDFAEVGRQVGVTREMSRQRVMKALAETARRLRSERSDLLRQAELWSDADKETNAERTWREFRAFENKVKADRKRRVRADRQRGQG